MRNGIWVRTLNILNLKYERLVHKSAKVVPLQVFGKFRLLLYLARLAVVVNEVTLLPVHHVHNLYEDKIRFSILF